MRVPAIFKSAALLVFICLAVFSLQAHAAVDSANIFDTVLTRYQTAALAWAGTITNRASWLFWLLVVISMIWTFGFMALRKADIGEFFAEFIRFTIFTGFFFWLLTNGPRFANSIIASLRQIGGEATGLGTDLSPSGIVDIGFEIFFKVLDQSSVWKPLDSAIGIVMAAIILVILALIGVNMLLLLCSGWILAYGGVFFLGFGGSRWTSDIAINYYKTVLSVAASLMAMILLIGIGKTFLDDYYSRMSGGITLKEMAVVMIVVIILLSLCNKIPQLLAGIITGASVGGASGVGALGAGAAIGAAGVAVAAAATGGAALAAGATSAAGGAQALMAAVQKAGQNMQSGNGMFAGTGGSGGSSGGGSSGGASSGSTSSGSGSSGSSSPMAAAMGGSGSGNGAAATSSIKSGESSNTAANDDTAGGDSDESESAIASAENDESRESETAATAGNTTSGTNDPGTTGSSKSGSGFRGAITTAALFSADVGANLAQGAATVAKEKASATRKAVQDRIDQTVGGKIANAIRSGRQADEPEHTFDNNSLSASNQSNVDAESEIAAFRDSKNHRKS